ncbi:MBL fold metallo-hydrolase [Candidatus Roizmanbacteria bacterium]|nr:MAG: MBL fold metallo-hydrolase [Candidatus Roizmanbacteria bacterium]
MQIKFLGAAGTVTGSSYVLTSGSGNSILIDLGMFQGTPDIEKLNNNPFEYNCSKLDGVVLTHAHLDHCGRLPILIPRGFKGKIWMTPPTRDLTELSLLDSAKIAIQDHKKALYDKNLAYRTIDRFKTMEYRAPERIGDFVVTMRDAGHILGSATLEIEDLRPNSEIQKIVFSGDLGNYPEDIVKTTEFIDDADAVVMESTYGDRLHADEDATAMLQAEINAVEQSGGTLLIPAFALERTQEILHMIMHLKKEGKVKARTPVFLDSPMADQATQIYMDYPEMFNIHITEDLENGGIFAFDGLEIIAKRSESRGLYFKNDAKVIIAGSGMMSGGRIVGHAAHYLSHSKNRIFIVGYQGEGTLGRELMEGQREVLIDGKMISVSASVNTTHAMSSHADQQQLMDWLKHIKQVKHVILTHGEDPSRNALSERVQKELGIDQIHLPHLHEEIFL